MQTPFLEESISVLSRTPATLDAMLRGLPDAWIRTTEGNGSWSTYEVIGHLIHGEKVDWIPRLDIILQYGTARAFEPFDREGHVIEGTEPPLSAMLDEFRTLRHGNLTRLRAMNLQESHLDLEGMHPELGRVKVRQLLATWTAHDLAHIVQIGRVMAKRYRQDVGPWAQYLSVMT